MRNERDEKERQRRVEKREEQLLKHGNACVICGSTEHLEFHHREKDKKVTHRIWTWKVERIEVELKKCDLLCRKCHHVQTGKERGYKTAPHGTVISYIHYKCRCTDCRRANAEKTRKQRLKVRT